MKKSLAIGILLVLIFPTFEQVNALSDATVMNGKLPSNRWLTSAIFDGNDAYIFGGFDGSNTFDDIVKYSPSKDTATVVGKLTNTKRGSSAVWTGKYAYIFGGVDESNRIYKSILRYDPSTNAVDFVGNLPVQCFQTSAIFDGTHAYIFGGYDANVVPMADIIRFDPITNTAVFLGTALPSNRGGTCAIWDGTNAYIFGGRDINRNYIDEIVRFHPQSGTVTTMTSKLPSPRAWSSAVWTGKEAIIFGGANPNGALDDIFRYDVFNDLIKPTYMLKLPTSRSYTSSIFNGTYAFIFGGNGGGSDIVRVDPKELNSPPSTPVLTGPSSSDLAKLCTFFAISNDLDGERINYTFSWGDETYDNTDSYIPGAQVQCSHIWYWVGTYEVKVKAFDENGAESLWSNSIFIEIKGGDLHVYISISPTTIYSGGKANVDITVIDFLNKGVSNATITLEATNGSFSKVFEIGNGNYNSTYFAPTVNSSISISIVVKASKSGYGNGSASSSVLIIPSTAKPFLQISIHWGKEDGPTSSTTIASDEKLEIYVVAEDSSNGKRVIGAYIEMELTPGGTLKKESGDDAMTGYTNNNGLLRRVFYPPPFQVHSIEVILRAKGSFIGYYEDGEDKLEITIYKALPPVIEELTSRYDGIDGDDIGTFLQIGEPVTNVFYAKAKDPNPTDEVISVNFTFKYEEREEKFVGKFDKKIGKWTATVDMDKLFWQPDIGWKSFTAELCITALDDKNREGNKTVKVFFQKPPLWLIQILSVQEPLEGLPSTIIPFNVEKSFDHTEGEYSIEASFPSEGGNETLDWIEKFKKYNIPVWIAKIFKDKSDSNWSFQISFSYSIPDNMPSVSGKFEAKVLLFKVPFNVSLELAIEMDKKWEIKKMSAKGGLTFKPRLPSPWLPPFGPWPVGPLLIDIKVVVSIEVEGSIAVNFEIGRDQNGNFYLQTADIELEPKVSLSLKAYLELYLGVIGFGAVFNSELKLKIKVGYIDNIWKFLLDLYLDLYLKLVFTVFFGIWEVPVYSWHWGPYKIAEIGGGGRGSAFSLPNKNLPKFTFPTLATFGNETLAVWTHETEQNGVELVYSFYKNGKWSAPNFLTKNYDAEINPQVAYLEDGRAMAIWTQAKIGSELNDFLNSQDLFYSIWNGEWSTPARITNDVLPDGMVSLAPLGSKAVAVWTKDEDGNISTSLDRKIYYSIFDGSWSKEAKLSSQATGSENSARIASYYGKVLAIWLRDDDGNFTTPDRNVYANYFDGSVWKEEEKISLNNGLPYSPNIAFGREGAHVVWVNEENGKFRIYYRNWKNGKWNDIVVANESIYHIMEANVKAKKNGEPIFFWRTADIDIHGEYYMATDLAKPIRITNNTYTEWMGAITVDENDKPLLIYSTYEHTNGSFGSASDNMFGMNINLTSGKGAEEKTPEMSEYTLPPKPTEKKKPEKNDWLIYLGILITAVAIAVAFVLLRKRRYV